MTKNNLGVGTDLRPALALPGMSITITEEGRYLALPHPVEVGEPVIVAEGNLQVPGGKPIAFGIAESLMDRQQEILDAIHEHATRTVQ